MAMTLTPISQGNFVNQVGRPFVEELNRYVTLMENPTHPTRFPDGYQQLMEGKEGKEGKQLLKIGKSYLFISRKNISLVN